MQTLEDIYNQTVSNMQDLGIELYREDIADLTEAGLWEDIFSDALKWNDPAMNTLVEKYRHLDLDSATDDQVIELIYILDSANEIMISNL